MPSNFAAMPAPSSAVASGALKTRLPRENEAAPIDGRRSIRTRGVP